MTDEQLDINLTAQPLSSLLVAWIEPSNKIEITVQSKAGDLVANLTRNTGVTLEVINIARGEKGDKGDKGERGDTGLSNYAFVKSGLIGKVVNIPQTEHNIETVSSVIGLNSLGEDVSIYYRIDDNETVIIESNVSLELLSIRIS